MEIFKDKKNGVDDGNLEQKIPRTIREQYLLEKERIKYEIGDLEQIRLFLGLSQRKVCQLLLVDPSAWTRWTKTLSGAPPHIYKALQWLVELKKINPESVVPQNLEKKIDYIQHSVQSNLQKLESNVKVIEKQLLIPQQAGIDYSVLENLVRHQTDILEKEIIKLKFQLNGMTFAKKRKVGSGKKKKATKLASKKQKKKKNKIKSYKKSKPIRNKKKLLKKSKKSKGKSGFRTR